MQMYLVAAAIGVMCAVSLAVGGRYFAETIPEGAAQLSWVAIVLGGAAICGYVRPGRAWRWGAVIVAVQPVCVFVLLLVAGELHNPSGSTGGMAVMVIFGLFAALFVPLAILASLAGASARAKKEHAKLK
jgi:ABC-type multidrug transport system permease subunit